MAQRTQPALLALLDEQGLSYQRFHLVNTILVRGAALDTVEQLARRSDVAFLSPNATLGLELPEPTRAAPASPSAIEGNLLHVNADDVWAMGYTGEGAVVGGSDTGYKWDHPALINQYRGWDGSTAQHDYNWHDAVHTPTTSCAANSPEPCDDGGLSGRGHGTHTMGIMVGNDLAPSDPAWPEGAANAVGIAPGAKWIGCRNIFTFFGDYQTYLECNEWHLAPYPYGGNPLTDGDPSKAAHVINNSWACLEGCPEYTNTQLDLMRQSVETLRAAGIVFVASAGNDGTAGFEDCGTIRYPPAIFDASFTVGSTKWPSDQISDTSSKGPVVVDGSFRLKPDITAPGDQIRSTLAYDESLNYSDSYGVNSGTSMSGPHVAGLVALLISAKPELAGEVDEIERIIRDTAVPLTSNQGCGGDGPNEVPNNVYGYGRIDALAAVQEALTPSAVELESFEASAQSDHILLAWVTVSERDNLGFNLFRATSPDGAQVQLNGELIPSQAPGSGQGFAYQWQDAAVEAGVTYFYWLEDVDFAGHATRHGPVSVTFGGNPTALRLAAAGPAPRRVPSLVWGLLGLGTLAGLATWRAMSDE